MRGDAFPSPIFFQNPETVTALYIDLCNSRERKQLRCFSSHLWFLARFAPSGAIYCTSGLMAIRTRALRKFFRRVSVAVYTPSRRTDSDREPAQITGANEWADAFAKAKAMVNQMTLEEKVGKTLARRGRNA